MTNNLPDLTTWDYDALKESIRCWRVILPVVKADGDLIDGRQRIRACKELNMIDYPVLNLYGLTEEEKRDHAYILNLVRRRLNQEQMRQLIAAELRRTPVLSDNWLAQILGTTDKTVAAVRAQLIATSEIPKLYALRGKDGKYRRVTRIITNTARQDEMAQEAMRILGNDAPRRDWDLRLAQRKVKRVQKSEMAKGREVQPPGDGDIRLYHCPFQKLEEVAGIESNSVHQIVTDIPYGRDFLPEVAELGAFAERVLVEGGLLVTYSGQFHLDHVMRNLSEHLTYRWIKESEIRNDPNLVHPYQILSFWKPILIYSKGSWKERPQWHDVSRAANKEKNWHDWQQPLDEVERLIQDFSDPGDLVVDPCGGGFTVAAVCQRLGDRSCISCDIDEAAVISGQDRLAGKTPGQVG